MSEDGFSKLLSQVVTLDLQQYEQLFGTLLEHFRYTEGDKAVAWRLKQTYQLLQDKNRK